MQSLISGAECSTTSNPLSQVLKHTDSDRSLQRDRIDGPSSSRLHHLPPSTSRPINAVDVAVARQFFDSANSQSNIPAFNGPMGAMSRHMLENLHQTPHAGPMHTPELAPAWVPSMNGSISPASGDSRWSEEFRQAPSVTPSATAHFNESHMPLYNVRPGYSAMNGMSQPFYQPPLQSVTPSVNWDQEFTRVDVKGKGKAVDLDFEDAFNRAASLANERSRIVEVFENESLEAAFERINLADNPGDGEALSDFEEIWSRLKHPEFPPSTEDSVKFESDLQELMGFHPDELEYGEDMERAWAINPDYEDGEHIQFDDDGIPILKPYKFETENHYLAEQGSHLTRAKQLLNENGSLTDAALLIEAAIQQGDLGEGGYEAWILLGETRSMDERENAGMQALTEGVRIAREAGVTGPGMLSLAISYTNESFDRASHSTLVRWLLAKYTSLVPEELKGPLPASQWASHDRAAEAFLAVARHHHAQGHMDPDLQIGLGVLFYTNSEFDKARDCFESALTARPKDYLLWNRLGSCLSNGSKPEEALVVYREALQLRPTYTRAIYNVGVACLNISAHKEAAEHFLSALAMQESVGGEKSEQLWQTLRKCFAAMNRQDLVEAAKAGQTLERFRKEGFEF
ncbi:peroxisome targeting signal receptor [Hysterangium stoloniferum]|nr:peroxisome targeting signal receptor [Hysterangium stoloniferum]